MMDIVGFVEGCSLLDEAVDLLEDSSVACSLVDGQRGARQTTRHIVAPRGRHHTVIIPIDDPHTLGDAREVLSSRLRPSHYSTQLSAERLQSRRLVRIGVA